MHRKWLCHWCESDDLVAAGEAESDWHPCASSVEAQRRRSHRIAGYGLGELHAHRRLRIYPSSPVWWGHADYLGWDDIAHADGHRSRHTLIASSIAGRGSE